ncbi:MAG: tRNA guanosine(34) transglycosylase Tgt [Chlorobi bacterium]|nr:MAG: tRNA guanosine(34) transglycosylase Tgt [Bacteroidota bacterium]MBE2266344.1 tRNA guanosine(34) transglycosylase Tgt [Flavobacteriales bacterium]MBL1160566.1 tRNA guanosine(34) transglycosylase Tgt [Chlorobiota bacterium]MBW7853186.1 tRNA guanosine(34) transglycosylase Tgt [Candidatus Kapabacteria bacterium]MCC6331325.1 tRNA guanosine(34) transglycosylase Tgt [Ignavibacteria bacterium]
MLEPAPPFFDLHSTDQASAARAGTISTDHGVIETPVFMPVGTQGAVKALDWQSVHDAGASIVLANTYHLYLRPGTDVLDAMGGFHSFSGWTKPLLTDSGGFQVWSLRELRSIDESGVWFRSHLDGSRHRFSPAGVVDIQRSIGSDIFMVLDECTPYPVSVAEARHSMERTVTWAQQAQQHHRNTAFRYPHRQFHFAIGQGSTIPEYRKWCMQELVDMDFDGYAIGGLSVGEPVDDLYRITEVSTSVMPENKPRYLMGVGTPENILRCIALGVDMFDCVMPTRNARNGTIFTSKGKVNIRNAQWKFSKDVLDDSHVSHVSATTQMAYLRHLFIAGEVLGLMIATLQNVAFYLWLTRTARQHILAGTFSEWYPEILRTVGQVRK